MAMWLTTACSGFGVAWRAGIAADGVGPVRPHDIVVVGVPPARAAMIAAHAASVRRMIDGILVGDAESAEWVPPCAIHVHADRSGLSRAVGGGPAAAGGATTIEFVGDRVSLRRIDVVDSAGGVPPALAHELVHVVLADRFTAAPPPRWADEGLATLFDTREKQRGHEADFRAADALGQAWSIADLMTLELDPADAARQRVFYGQSASLVRWLLARQDGPTFLRFLDAIEADGMQAALRAHYGVNSIADLEAEWRASTPIPASSDVIAAATAPSAS